MRKVSANKSSNFFIRLIMTLSVILVVMCTISTTNVHAATKKLTVTNSKGNVLETFEVDTSAAKWGIQYALNYCREYASEKDNYIIKFPKATYVVESGWTLNCYSNTVIDLSSGATIKRTDDYVLFSYGTDYDKAGIAKYNGWKNFTIKGGTIDGNGKSKALIQFAHSQKIKLDSVTFTNIKDGHFVEIAASKNITIKKCTFKKQKISKPSTTTNYEAIQLEILNKNHFPEGKAGKYDGTVNKNITIDGCTFTSTHRGVGTHNGEVGRYFDKIKITNNTFTDNVGYAIRGTNWKNATITGNTIKNCGSGIYFNQITDNRKNYYPGKKKNVTTKLNSTISKNTISIKATAFKNNRYGINVFGEKTTKSFKGDDGAIPAADYRVSGMTISKNKITLGTEANGIWLRGVLSSKITDNTIVSKATTEKQNYDGIRIGGVSNISGGPAYTTEKLTVKGNKITDKKKKMRAGIYIMTASKKSKITGNKIKGTRVYSIGIDAAVDTSSITIKE